MYHEPFKLTLNNISKTSDPIRTVRSINNQGVKAIIAGGSIRDLYTNTYFDQYDIFVQHLPSVLVNEIYILKILNIPISAWNRKSNTYNVFNDIMIECRDPMFEIDNNWAKDHITQVWSVSYGLTNYSLIFIDKDPILFVHENFDLAICKGYCDGHKIHYTSEFLHDIKNQTITITNKHLREDTLNELLESDFLATVRFKYNNFKLQVDPSLAKYINDDNISYFT